MNLWILSDSLNPSNSKRSYVTWIWKISEAIGMRCWQSKLASRTMRDFGLFFSERSYQSKDYFSISYAQREGGGGRIISTEIKTDKNTGYNNLQTKTIKQQNHLTSSTKTQAQFEQETQHPISLSLSLTMTLIFSLLKNFLFFSFLVKIAELQITSKELVRRRN